MLPAINSAHCALSDDSERQGVVGVCFTGGEGGYRLEARVAEFEAEQQKLGNKKAILRQAAEYFAGKTNWGPLQSSPITDTPSRGAADCRTSRGHRP